MREKENVFKPSNFFCIICIKIFTSSVVYLHLKNWFVQIIKRKIDSLHLHDNNEEKLIKNTPCTFFISKEELGDNPSLLLWARISSKQSLIIANQILFTCATLLGLNTANVFYGFEHSLWSLGSFTYFNQITANHIYSNFLNMSI